MKLTPTRRAPRRLDLRLRTYGVTALLGVAALGGAVPQCVPAAPTVSVVSDVQNPVVQGVNQHRARAGRAALVIDSRLTTAAQDHSTYMARQQVMSHVGAGGTRGGQRITNAGYRWWTWGENVAAGQTTATQVVSDWMNSTSHRATILNSNMVHIGVAAAKGTNGVIYWTMLVAAPG